MQTVPVNINVQSLKEEMLQMVKALFVCLQTVFAWY